jgi:hypothetical protein
LENIDVFVASFDSTGNVRLENTLQLSGKTANDFRKDLLYTVTSGAVEKKYMVKFNSPQATGLPVIKIDVEGGAPIVSKEDYLNADIRILDPDREEYNLMATTEIRGRGNSTWIKPPKKPYRLKLSKKESLFGLPKAKSWVLLANFFDTTYIKASLAFELESRLGMSYPNHYVHVELFLNGKYQGTYLLTEQIQVDSNRIDIDENDGFLVEMDSYYDEDPKFRTDILNLPTMIKSPEDLDDPSGYDFVKNAVNNLEAKLFDVSFPENGYRNLIDLDSFVYYIMLQDLLQNNDALQPPNNVYILKDSGTDAKIKMGPPWDFDHTFYWPHNTNIVLNASEYLINYYSGVKFFHQFFGDPVFVARYKEIWNANKNKFSEMEEFIDETSALLAKTAAQDRLIEWTPGEDYPSLHSQFHQCEIYNKDVCAIEDYQREIEKMKTLLRARIEYYDSLVNGL